MTTMTLGLSRPAVPSPLANPAHTVPPAQRMVPKRGPSFPHSRALRPFPTISHLVQPAKGGQPGSKAPIKLIEPPKNFKASLNSADKSESIAYNIPSAGSSPAVLSAIPMITRSVQPAAYRLCV
ncbi:hypothetical protein CPB83DRAFT_901243 [Crepidotus variabilis]|uniref:Uncharacterized protein n=1 Tax=Crepidotus variabilis TaxID=179855 RepID=A0A9P6JX57_9AGAR|nr:hypothetical protein CPB83DRAFT_901243 [Crepidotus variabilis]